MTTHVDPGTLTPANDDDEIEIPSYQLNGDPRLQFWREAYLTALPVLLERFADTGGDADYLVASASRAATTAADCAVAQHLSRCNADELDAIVFGLLAPAPPANAVSRRRVPQ